MRAVTDLMGPAPSLACTVLDSQTVGGPCWVGVAGEVDLATAAELGRSLRDAQRRSRVVVVVDLTDVTFMDSSGLHVLLDAHERAVRIGSRVVVVGPSRSVARLFEITGAARILDIVDAGDVSAPALPAADDPS